MPNKIGRFEVLSELAHSELGCVYKASDPESGQTVVLKAIHLQLLGEQAAALVKHILEEAETAKVLNSHNIAALYGAGEMEGQLVACMEYVQGNSVGTMLARKEGFSIWDLQDIARQTCQGLDHARVHSAVHYSLEPAKVMVQWDGTVKMLGFGISTMGAYAAQASGQAPDVLHYMSPEQLRGDPVDARSNLFSLGTILYEMVTERKAFQGEDADQVRQSILEMTPVAPDQINRKIHPALSEVIMKVLSKAPGERYSSGQDLVNDLERCKESATKVAAKKPPQPPPGSNAPQKSVPAAGATATAKQTPAAGVPSAKAIKSAKESVSRPARTMAKAAAEEGSGTEPGEMPGADTPAAAKKAAAAAMAGWESPTSTTVGGPRTPKLDPSAQFITSCVKASVEALSQEEATMSSAPTVEPGAETRRIAVDPMMDEGKGAGTQSRSFSEIDELPPLKEVYVAPPQPPSALEPEPPPEPPKATLFMASPPVRERPRVQPREAAKKAVTEIKKTPPKLFMYSIAAAIGFILLVVILIAFHIHSENSDEDSTPAQSSAPASAEPAELSRPPAPGAGRTTASTQVQAPVRAVTAEPLVSEPAVSVKPKYRNARKTKTPATVTVTVPGQLNISSTPEGAQVHVDGRNDPSWVTPFNMTGLAPGQHTVLVNKPGYSAETRTIDVASGSKSFLVVQLAALTAVVSVGSEPAGASVFMDGKDTGRVTPTQISADKPGNHTILVRKQGYLEETTTANLQAGQSFHFAPTLRILGSTDEIKTAGKFKKMFGGGGGSEVGTVSIKTQPKGAQIAINRRMLDKASPVEFYLNPGTYVVDITSSGYKTIHRVITVEKGNKIAIDESMERE
jgi:serine/threonine-protein kinase